MTPSYAEQLIMIIELSKTLWPNKMRLMHMPYNLLIKSNSVIGHNVKGYDLF